MRPIEVVSIDPHERYRFAVTNSELLGDITIVVDPIHIVRLSGLAVTKCHRCRPAGHAVASWLQG